MPRKKKIEEELPQDVVIEEPVMLSTNDIVEPVEMIWVETVDAMGRHMILVPKEG